MVFESVSFFFRHGVVRCLVLISYRHPNIVSSLRHLTSLGLERGGSHVAEAVDDFNSGGVGRRFDVEASVCV